MRSTGIVRTALAVVLATSLGGRALAQPAPTPPPDPVGHTLDDAEREAYRIAFTDGTAAFERGAWAEARAAFERAYALDPRPIVVFNIASTYRREGDAARARERYLAFLVTGNGDPALDALARNAIAELDAALANAPEPTPAARPAPLAPPARAPAVTRSTRPSPPVRRPRGWLVATGLGVASAGGALIGLGVRLGHRADELAESATLPGAPQGHATGAGAGSLALGAGIALIGAGALATAGAAWDDAPAPSGRPALAARWESWAVVAGTATVLGGYFAYRFGNTRDELAALAERDEPLSFAEVDALEDRAHRQALIADVALGTAAVAGLASVAALVLEHSSTAALEPQLTADGAQLGLRASF